MTLTEIVRGLAIFLPVTGLTGGGSTKLDGIPTTTLAVGTQGYLNISGVVSFYRLTAGTSAENSPDIIRPDDYVTTTNEKIWVLCDATASDIAARGDLNVLALTTLGKHSQVISGVPDDVDDVTVKANHYHLRAETAAAVGTGAGYPITHTFNITALPDEMGIELIVHLTATRPFVTNSDNVVVSCALQINGTAVVTKASASGNTYRHYTSGYKVVYSPITDSWHASELFSADVAA